MDSWNKIFKPIVVLACICIVVTAALALTNKATAPRIAELAEIAAAEAREELMPGVSFSQVDCTAPNITAAYQSDDGSAILTAVSKGYGGTFVTMVAFDGDGNIVRVKVQDHAETKGIGDKVEVESFWGQYSGLSTENHITLDVEVDKVSGATISSKAVNNGVNYAIDGFQTLS
ncbi:MAG: FMN-binding protein [Eubacteriales bacterium]